jgi:hypothetical protein
MIRVVSCLLVGVSGVLLLAACAGREPVAVDGGGLGTWRSGVHAELNHPVADANPLVLFHADDYTARQALLSSQMSEVVFINCLLTDAAFRDISVHNPGLTRIEFRVLDEVSDGLAEPEGGTPAFVQFYRGVTSATLSELARLPRLRHLVAEGLNVDEAGMSTLFESASSLESLMLGPPQDFPRLRRLKNLYRCTTLRTLHVVGPNEQDLKDIGKSAGLERLIFEYGGSSHESLLALANLTTLRSLALLDGGHSTLELSDAALGAVVEANPHLEDLSIWFGYGAEGAWTAALRHVPKLRRLSLIGTRTDFSDASPSVWSALPLLEELTLVLSAELDAAHVRAIAALPRLKSLRLEEHGGTRGLEYLLRNKSIVSLTLKGFEDGEKAVELLAEAQHLALLNLEYARKGRLTPAQIEYLRTALPNCVIRPRRD